MLHAVRVKRDEEHRRSRREEGERGRRELDRARGCVGRGRAREGVMEVVKEAVSDCKRVVYRLGVYSRLVWFVDTCYFILLCHKLNAI